MIIKKIGLGNYNEGYIERKLNDGFNIIISDDNNRGKTIVMQSALFSLGNQVNFPKNFNYKDYYHYIILEHEGKNISICRNKSNFILQTSANFYLADSVSEFKRIFSDHVVSLPQIIKDNENKIVDPELFVQLFFLPQDDRTTSNVFNKYYYNKRDYKNMLYALKNIDNCINEKKYLEKIKAEIKSLKQEKNQLIKDNKILNSSDKAISYVSNTNDSHNFSILVNQAESIISDMSKFKRSRNALLKKKVTWNKYISEIKSINYKTKGRKLVCGDCGSDNIVYSDIKNQDFHFDLSSAEMRVNIINAINEKIKNSELEIEKYTDMINSLQDELNYILEEKPIDLKDVVRIKNDYNDVKEIEKKIIEIDAHILELDKLANAKKIFIEQNSKNEKDLINELLNIMNYFLKIVDPDSGIIYEDVFTKSDEIYSGSDATIFYLARLYAYARVFKHSFPIIVDSFRSEELSTIREGKVIDLFANLSNQIIFTSTIKKEEDNKYEDIDNINIINYSNHKPSHILSDKYVDSISKDLSSFLIES